MKDKNLFIKVILGLIVICATAFILIKATHGADVNQMGVILIATFVIFNSTFLIWCFIYTVTGLMGTLIEDLILKRKKEFVK